MEKCDVCGGTGKLLDSTECKLCEGKSLDTSRTRRR